MLGGGSQLDISHEDIWWQEWSIHSSIPLNVCLGILLEGNAFLQHIGMNEWSHDMADTSELWAQVSRLDNSKLHTD